jgi:tetratricopeptide (TPR) repeat protein
VNAAANDPLDTDELLHLALRAADQNQHEQAIVYLKRALEQSPRDARLHYMLGAEHAQIGLYDRAAQEMERAVELDPGLSTAHFQLGLLHLTSARVERAEQAWAPLDQLDSGHCLRLFKTGLLHLARDEFQQCADLLARGMAANTLNASLNQDMERVLDQVQQRLAASPQAAVQPEAAAPPSARAPGHVLLSAYRRNRTQDDEQ